MVLSHEIDYSLQTLNHPQYIYNKISPLTQPPATLSAGGDQVEFECPNVACNLHKSKLRFIVAPTSAPSNANYSNKMYATTVPALRNIELYTRSGRTLVSITDVDMYLDAVWNYEDMSDMISAPSSDGGVTGGLAQAEVVTGLCSIDAATTANQTYRQVTTQKPYVSRRELFVGLNTTLSPTIEYILNFGKIRNSLFSRDIDLLFGENVYLRITFNSTAQITHEATSATNANISVQAAQTVTLSGLELHLAVEQNPMIIADLHQAIKSEGGLKIDFDYVYPSRQSFGAVTAQNFMTRFNSGYGKNLRKIYWTGYNTPQTLVARFDNSTVSTTLASWNSFLNAKQLENQTMTPALDFIMQSDVVEGTVVGDRVAFLNKFVHLEDFTGKNIDGIYYSDGIPLDGQEVQYQVQTICGATANIWYIWCVVQRSLKISNAGVEVF